MNISMHLLRRMRVLRILPEKFLSLGIIKVGACVVLSGVLVSNGAFTKPLPLKEKTPLTLWAQATDEPVRYYSLRSSKVNMRRGPSKDHGIVWVYTSRGLPMKYLGRSGEWIRVQDFEESEGWIHGSLLSKRSTVVTLNETSLRQRPQIDAPAKVLLRRGVVAQLVRCQDSWCEVRGSSFVGWVEATNVWGGK